MKSLLIINSSARFNRSLTRHLTNRYAAAWHLRHPTGRIINRDVGVNPPPAVSESWIAGAFAKSGQLTTEMSGAIAVSDELISELNQADAIVIGAPMYNFGVPAQLKAYIDQIVRIGKTFSFDPSDSENPYRPLIASKPVIVIVSAGDGALHPGGDLVHLNFLEPHLVTVLNFIGLSDISFIRVGYDEYKDDRFKKSLADAELAVDQLVDDRRLK
jgi:FMN-dependent NADH-azoreductase